MQIVRQTSFEAVPWKNGGGVTHEAMRVPADGDRFRWRVSVARIEVSGPFSDFTGYQRRMVLLKGGGVELRFANGTVSALRAVGEMAEFDGALAVQCELIDGPCVDLNLIVARALPGTSARVARLHETLTVPGTAGQVTLAFPIDTAVALSCGSARAVLDAGDLALIPAGQDLMLRVAGHADARSAAVFLANLPE
jgi:environmental stress-induced protein Ves